MYGNNIVLIGMPGAGKSTVGVILAKVLGYEFLDSDLVIQREEGKRLFEIIDAVGTDGFLAVENRVNAGLDVSRTIIATGGSAVFGAEAMEHLKQDSVVVYLELPFEVIEERVSNAHNRGVAMQEGQTLRDVFDIRRPLYEKYADVTVNADLGSPERVMTAICEALGLD